MNASYSMDQAKEALTRAQSARAQHQQVEASDWAILIEFESQSDEMKAFLQSFEQAVRDDLHQQADYCQYTKALLAKGDASLVHVGRCLAWLKRSDTRLVFLAVERIAWRLARIVSSDSKDAVAEDMRDLKEICDRLQIQFAHTVTQAELEWATFAQETGDQSTFDWCKERLERANDDRLMPQIKALLA